VGRITAVALIAIVVVSTVFGLLLDPKPFVENLLAETSAYRILVRTFPTTLLFSGGRQRQ